MCNEIVIKFCDPQRVTIGLTCVRARIMRPEFLEERKSKKEIGQSEKEIGQMVFCKIQLFSEKYFTGQCQGFVENFASLGYRRCTPKSAIVEDGAWTLYSNLGFQGTVKLTTKIPILFKNILIFAPYFGLIPLTWVIRFHFIFESECSMNIQGQLLL